MTFKHSQQRRLLHQAEQHLQAGRPRQAEALYLQVLKKDPRHPRALHQLGILRYRAGKLAAAAANIERALALAPNNASIHADLGVVLRQLGRREEALNHYQASIRLAPDLAATHNNLGNLLVDLGRRDQAIKSFERALALDPSHIGARLNLADALRAAGRLAEAEVACQRILQCQPGNPAALNILGAVRVDQHRLDDAIAQFRSATEHAPGFALAYRNWGTILQRQGRVEEAAAIYRKVLQLQPADTTALRYLSRNVTFKPGDPELARMEQLLTTAQLTPEARVDLHFALGKAQDDAGDYAKAFANFTAANRLVRQSQPYSAQAHSALVDRLVNTYSPAFFQHFHARYPQGGSDSQRPVFVLGMPRSGTTLVEQILASHPAVFGAGEVSALLCIPERLPALLGAEQPYPECLGHWCAPAASNASQAQPQAPQSTRIPAPDLTWEQGPPATLWRTLAEEFLNLLTRQAGAAERVIDKTPFNFLVLGLIQLLFPRARVIHCRRDPLDTGLSSFVTCFTDPVPFAADLADIGAYYRDYQRLMAHWRATLRLSILEIHYESLVADQERVSRQMIDFLGLPWSERCLAFHQTQRVVRTASTWQVRQPMYASAVGRWRHYEPWLEPLKQALLP